MTLEFIDIISTLLQTVVLGVLLFFTIRLLLRNKESVTVVFMSFCFALWFFSNLYWVVYDILRPDTRMPFAANEFGEAGLLLMLAAILNSAVPHGSRVGLKQTIGAVIFGACNVALWIAWSGEWVQDILIGLVVTWLIYSAVCSMKVTRVLSKAEWILLGVYCALLIAGQTLTFVFDDPVKSAIDTGCYVLLSLGIVYFLIKLCISFCKREPSRKQTSIIISAMVWDCVCLYMSADMMYRVFLNVETVLFVLMYLAVRKVASGS